MSQIEKTLIQERLATINSERFSSLLMQIESVTNINEKVKDILEIGPGNQFFSTIIKMLGYDIKTNDIRKRTNPDYYGDVRKIKIQEKFDLIVAFEVLQHMPFEELNDILKKLGDISNNYILISLPYQVHNFSINIKLPYIFFPRKLKLGYNRAGRIVDQLEATGIIGPHRGSKARDVLIPDIIALEQFLSNLREQGKL